MEDRERSGSAVDEVAQACSRQVCTRRLPPRFMMKQKVPEDSWKNFLVTVMYHTKLRIYCRSASGLLILETHCRNIATV